eukprot:g29887.t1
MPWSGKHGLMTRVFSRGNPYALENLRLLLDSRADPNNLSKLGGQSASDSYKSALKIRLLGWENCSNLSRYQATLLGCTPLHAAAFVGDTAIVELLCQYGAEQTPNYLGMLPEDLAEKKGYCHLMKLFSTFLHPRGVDLRLRRNCRNRGTLRRPPWLSQAPYVARANERHEWEYGQRQHQAALRNIQNQASIKINAPQTCTRKAGDSYLRRAQVGRENRKLVEKLESIAKGYGAWDPRAPPSKEDYTVTPGPFVAPRGEAAPSLTKRVRSLNEPYRYRMQQALFCMLVQGPLSPTYLCMVHWLPSRASRCMTNCKENAAMVNRILSIGPTFNRKVEAAHFGRHKRTEAVQNLQRFMDRGSLPRRSLPSLRVPRPSSTWTTQGLEALLLPGDLCRVGSAPAFAPAAPPEVTSDRPLSRDPQVASLEVTLDRPLSRDPQATPPEVTLGGPLSRDPQATPPQVTSDRGMVPASPSSGPLSRDPQVGHSLNGSVEHSWDMDQPTERRRWLSSDVGNGGTNVASPKSQAGTPTCEDSMENPCVALWASEVRQWII